MNRHRMQKFGFVCILMVAYTPVARPQEQDPQAETNPKGQVKAVEPEADTNAGTEVPQKATQNPVASLVSVPVQNNNNFGVNPGYRTQDVLNIQLVKPIGISKDWNLLVRWIAPIVYQPVPNAPGTPETGEYGLGDTVRTFFLSAKKPGKLIWGVGPVLPLTTATTTFLGQGKLGPGPSVVLLTRPGHWTRGILANNIWSVVGLGSRPAVNQFLLQPPLTANSEAASSNQIGAVWLRSGKNHETFPVSQINQRAGRDAHGEKTATDGTGPTAEELKIAV